MGGVRIEMKLSLGLGKSEDLACFNQEAANWQNTKAWLNQKNANWQKKLFQPNKCQPAKQKRPVSTKKSPSLFGLRDRFRVGPPGKAQRSEPQSFRSGDSLRGVIGQPDADKGLSLSLRGCPCLFLFLSLSNLSLLLLLMLFLFVLVHVCFF